MGRSATVAASDNFGGRSSPPRTGSYQLSVDGAAEAICMRPNPASDSAAATGQRHRSSLTPRQAFNPAQKARPD